METETTYKDSMRKRRINRIKKSKNKGNMMEKFAEKIMQNLGSVKSILIHTILFALAFVFIFLGFERNTVLLVLTTIVSLEAIYLSLFIQMGVNSQAKRLLSVASDVGALQKDVDEISENVEEIQEDVGEIQEDVEDIQGDIQDEDDEDDDESIKQIKSTLDTLMEEILDLKKNIEEDDDKDIEEIKKNIKNLIREVKKIDSRNKTNDGKSRNK